MRLYGIKSCASVKKAKDFFENNSVEYEFIDISRVKVPRGKIEYWLNFVEPKALFNTRGKAYRELNLKGSDLNKKINHLWEDNLLIKRPVIEHGLNGEEKLHVGFNEEEYKNIFCSMQCI